MSDIVPDHDDEYANAGMFDPKIVVTTSRDPSSRLDQFTKEMRLVFPGAQKINRGNYVIKELADACRANGVTDLIIFHETRGEPGVSLGPPALCSLPPFAPLPGNLTMFFSFPPRWHDRLALSLRPDGLLLPSQCGAAS